jgi:hypothetical protein
MPQVIAVSAFDYLSLDAETCQFVQKQTGEIRMLMRRTTQDIFEIGRKLIEIKKRLGHGRFLDWLEAEFDWTERTARHFMRVAEVFEPETVSHLPLAPSALYLLAAPSTPEIAREEALTRAQAGESITKKTAQKIKQKHTSGRLHSKRKRTTETTSPTQEDSQPSSPTQDVVEFPKARGEILAIRPREAAQENLVVASGQADTPTSLPSTSKLVEPGTWWQLGEHLLYCGSPTSVRFKERLPQQVALSLAFPPNPDWRLDVLSQAQASLALFAGYGRRQDSQDWLLLREAIERFLDLYTAPQEVVVFSFLPDPEWLRLAHEFDCRCIVGEPDAVRCEAAIADWKKTGQRADKVSRLRF